MDIDISRAMLCWSQPFDDVDHPTGKAIVVEHPDVERRSKGYTFSVGACGFGWNKKDARTQLFQLLIDAWHAVTFYHVPAEHLHEAMMVIPQYRNILAEDCLPTEFRHERA